MMPKLYVWYWHLTDAQHSSFCAFYGYTEGNTPFTQIDGEWYLLQSGNDSIFDELLEWDEDDGTPGAGTNFFDSNYWTLSTVPAVMWP